MRGNGYTLFIYMTKRHTPTSGLLRRCPRLALFMLLALCAGQAGAQESVDEGTSALEQRMSRLEDKWEHMPKIHGILRGKYEYEPGLNASRFEVRNARLSAEGSLPLRSAYKLEVDLCDESSIKMKDARTEDDVAIPRTSCRMVTLILFLL